jgi:hypothetical protein
VACGPRQVTLKLSMTVIGDETACATVLGDMKNHPALAQLRDKVVVHAYRPTDVMVAKFGFKTGGRPTIYLQKADGEVVLRRDDYEGGAPELMAAVRRADPSYDPLKDPDGKPKVQPSPLAGPIEIPDHYILIGGVAGAALLLVALQRKQQ